MTLEKLQQIANNLPGATALLVEDSDGDYFDVEMVSIEYHNDGRAHLIMSNK